MSSNGIRSSSASASSATGKTARFGRDLPFKVEALDGLRGVAILMVVFGHFHSIISADPDFYEVTPWVFANTVLSRGFLGVDLFFVLSGFLITSLLLRMSIQSPTYSLRQFYIRRVLRLFPALFALLMVSFIVAYLEKFPMSDQWATTWPALIFLSNWSLQWNLNHFQSDLGHLWSLAVEEQFYLFWPSVVLLVRWSRNPRWLAFFIVIFMISWVLFHRSQLWDSGEPWLFLYSQTDTRIESMLVGCFFAFVYRYANFSVSVVEWWGFIAFLILVPLAFQFADERQPFLYKGGFTLIAFGFGLIILACVSSDSVATKILRLPVLQWFGKVSYGLYLWHALIFRMAERHMNYGSVTFRIVAATVLSILIAHLSWRYIEQPFLQLKSRRFQG